MTERVDNKRVQQGITIVELLVVVSITGLLVIGLSLLVRTGFNSSRLQFRQGLTTEDARVQLKRMSTEIRNAQAGSGDWLITANDNELVIKGDVDADEDVEQLRYTLVSDDLVRGVVENGGSESTRTAARSLKNTAQGQALFTYYSSSGLVLGSGERTSENVRRIQITLFIDVQGGGVAEVSTFVVIRIGVNSDDYLTAAEFILSGDPPDEDQVQAILYNADGSSSEKSINIHTLNNGYLGTYHDDHHVNLNYLVSDSSDGFSQGWYTWVGPIALGSGSQTDQISLTQLTSSGCLDGSSLEDMLGECSTRTVSYGGYSEMYQPIYIFTDPTSGRRYYVRNITIDQTGSEAMCPQQTTTLAISGSDDNGSTEAWINPTYASTSDNIKASVVVAGVSCSDPSISEYLYATNFGFAIPGGNTIRGIVAEVERDASNNQVRDNRLRLIKGGTVTSVDKANTSTYWTLGDKYVSYGGSDDLWGNTWTPSDINSSNFGLALSVSVCNPASVGNARVDHVRLSVIHTSDDLVDVVTSATSPTSVTSSGFSGSSSSIDLEAYADECVAYCNPTTPTSTDTCAFFLHYPGSDDVGGSGDFGPICECFGSGPSAPVTPSPNSQINSSQLNATLNSCNASCSDSYLTCGYSGNRTTDWCSCSCTYSECGDGICNAYRDETSITCPADCSF